MAPEKNPADALFEMFEERMAEMCSVVPSEHSKSIVSEEWFSYLDSLHPQVESIRPTDLMRRREVVVKKRHNIPVISLLAERINSRGFDGLLIEDPGISRSHVPTWGPNLLLVSREFADKALLLGCLP